MLTSVARSRVSKNNGSNYPRSAYQERNLLLVRKVLAGIKPFYLIRGKTPFQLRAVELRKDVGAAGDLLHNAVGPVPSMGKQLPPLRLQRPIKS